MNWGNIGNVYSAQGNNTKALESYFKALEIDNKLGNKRNVSGWLANIGGAYQLQGDSANVAGNTRMMTEMSSKALEYYTKALKLSEELG
ncbi:MAG: tetratricopeptide repeat protein, partial [Bacteroidia bacterium]|nr:tetratricopeptide repeat protein [Bacteroidia bacterium]